MNINRKTFLKSSYLRLDIFSTLNRGANLKINKEKINSNLKECFSLEEEDNFFKCDISYISSNKREIKISKTNFNNPIKNLENLKFNNVLLYNNQYFEQLLYAPIGYRSLFNDSEKNSTIKTNTESVTLIVKDVPNGFIYEISRPSIEFILASYSQMEFNENNLPPFFIADYLRSGKINLKLMKESIQRRTRIVSRMFRDETGQTVANFDDFLRVHSRIYTVKIISMRDIKCDIFDKLCNSFLFLVGYHRHVPLMEFRIIEPNVKPIKSFRSIEINHPQRIFNEKLIYYYQQALSTDNPVLKYLSYYQILEHFFDIVAKENIIKEVRDNITHPDFSNQNDESLEDLINLINTPRREDKKDLLLVFEKYLKDNLLKKDLINYNSSYYDDLKKNGVKFADAQKLEEKGKKNLITKQSLSERIIKVRNALTHSKQGKKRVYVPFTKDEAKLRKELPLMRLVAEQIIINSSDKINDSNLGL